MRNLVISVLVVGLLSLSPRVGPSSGLLPVSISLGQDAANCPRRGETMETFCNWKDCDASYAGDPALMPAGWANFVAVGIDQPLPYSVTLCPEHAQALRDQLKEIPIEEVANDNT